MSARNAADLASLLPMDHPLAQIARLRLDAHVRAERNLMKVESPNPDFTGLVAGVEFVDGHAETSDESALNYFRASGYRVGGRLHVDPEVVEEIDPRDVSEPVVIGGRLRDASVDSEDWRR